MVPPTHLKPVHAPDDHPDTPHGRVGVLLINLGTPDATDYWSMRRYLKEFLSDRRVIDTNPLLWWPLLNGIILTTRPGRSGANYDKIWNKERDESPLRTVTRNQAEGLAARLGANADGTGPVVVDWAMRYGTPAISDRLEKLQQAGAERILVAPLYPQYSATSTATALDKVYETLIAMRWQPAIRTLPPFYDHPAHIEALKSSVIEHLGTLDWEPEMMLSSFHGLPKRYLTEGDPYYCHAMKTGRLLRDAIGYDEENFQVVFQSRFGREEWLQPYIEPTVAQLGQGGVKRLAVVMPGFVADCLETLEEIAIGIGQTFRANGGEKFTAIPCLNDTGAGLTMLEKLVRQELAGWV
ncbi:Ferrochelatase, protoheme ferro-lyase [hydrothermal vent metagenome]|uniref:Ferrochelatase, protoheme ferro-lyase n=1 Tax=hydrothermal vent metagenome TaxID=652676 RepID=A0A3B0TJJ6_9ZZZZ